MYAAGGTIYIIFFADFVCTYKPYSQVTITVDDALSRISFYRRAVERQRFAVPSNSGSFCALELFDIAFTVRRGIGGRLRTAAQLNAADIYIFSVRRKHAGGQERRHQAHSQEYCKKTFLHSSDSSSFRPSCRVLSLNLMHSTVATTATVKDTTPTST